MRKQLFQVWWVIAFSCLSTSQVFSQQESATELLRRIDQSFRSSSRDIPAFVLYKEAYNRLDQSTRQQLTELTEEEWIEALGDLKEELEINRGVAENLFKIWLMSSLCANSCSFTSTGDRLLDFEGREMSRDNFDRRLEAFPEVTEVLSSSGREFDYKAYLIERMFVREALQNDWYNPRGAAKLWMEGKNAQALYRVFLRGNSEIAYWIAAGQDQVIDFLKHFRFSEYEISVLRNNPQNRDVPKEFWDYLRAWKFTGSIRGVPVGTVVFRDQAVMEIETDAVSHHLIESLILPIMGNLTAATTRSARLTDTMSGRAWVEGGGRRGGDGMSSALGALYGGALGTSNIAVSDRFGTQPYGSMFHARMAYWASELDSFVSYLSTQPDSTVLVDTYNIVNGIRHAIRAGGAHLAGFRIDSNLSGLSMADSIRSIRDFLSALGYEDLPIGVSNRLDEFEMNRMGSPSAAPFTWGLVGSAIAKAPNPAFVYKVVAVQQADGSWSGEAKLSEGKEGIPGAVNGVPGTQTYRFHDADSGRGDGQFQYDLITSRELVVEGAATPLMRDLVRDGERLVPRADPNEVARQVRAQVLRLPHAVRDVNAEEGVYPVKVSAELLRELRRIKEERLGDGFRNPIVLIFIGSYDPPHEDHYNMMKRAALLHRADQMIVVPTGDRPAHGKQHRYSAQERAAMISAELPALEEEIQAIYEGIGERDIHFEARLSDVEVRGETRFTADTLAFLKSELGRDADIKVVVGSDVFAGLAGNREAGHQAWRRAEEILSEYDWVVASRSGTDQLPVNAELEQMLRDLGYASLSATHWVRADGRRIELNHFRTGDLSSSELRRESSSVRTLWHIVDPQKTFREAMHREEAGSLAVPGSAETVSNIERIVVLGRRDPRGKLIVTGDHHFETEVRNPQVWNREFTLFSQANGFQPHGMAYMSGPRGAEFIQEVTFAVPESEWFRVPHHRELIDPNTGEGRLELVDFNPSVYQHLLVDPRIVLRVEKNGHDSIDVWNNPNFVKTIELILQSIQASLSEIPGDPLRVVVSGWATDYCVEAAVNGYLAFFDSLVRDGVIRSDQLEIILVSDAIAGIFPDENAARQAGGDPSANIKQAIERMTGSGVRLMTTAQVESFYSPMGASCDEGLGAAARAKK